MPRVAELTRCMPRDTQVLVDALPYLDKEYDQPAMRDLVDGCGLVRARARARAGVLVRIDTTSDALPPDMWQHCRMIDEEMEQFEPEDYISSLPPLPAPSFAEGSILAQELARVEADPTAGLSAVDTSRYQPQAPSGKQAGKTEAWEEAVARAQTMQEHQGLRLVNDELMQQYGVNAWRAFNSGLEDRNELLKKELELEKLRVLDMNRKRMAAQVTIEGKIRKLEDRYQQAVAKNMRIEAECIALEKMLPPTEP